MRAELDLPVDLTVKAVGHGMVWGTTTDDLGVTYVKGYRFGAGP